MLRIGIVGHRRLASEAASRFVAEACADLLARARQRDPETVALSAIAEGADTLFAQAALELGLPLEIIRPFAEYEGDFDDAESLERYRRLRASARRETRLRFVRRSVRAYRAAMLWIVRNADVLVLAWDGRDHGGAGGTGDAVREALRMRRPWIHLDPVTFSIREHPGGAGPEAAAA